MKKGFTLIELLVVVLIIGILSAIALPQYERTVEKARMVEATTNMAIIKRAIEMYLLNEGKFPSSTVQLQDVLSATGTELSGGTWSNNKYTTSHFTYEGTCNSVLCDASANQGDYCLFLMKDELSPAWKQQKCYNQNTAFGTKMCKNVEGWTYEEGGC